jgi:hypothetical protein
MRKDSENFEKQLKIIQVNLLSASTPAPTEDKEEKSESHEKKSPKKH